MTASIESAISIYFILIALVPTNSYLIPPGYRDQYAPIERTISFCVKSHSEPKNLTEIDLNKKVIK